MARPRKAIEGEVVQKKSLEQQYLSEMDLDWLLVQLRKNYDLAHQMRLIEPSLKALALIGHHLQNRKVPVIEKSEPLRDTIEERIHFLLEK